MRSIFVWDLPTRLFHWMVVVLVAVTWVSGEGGGLLFIIHSVAGYGIFVLLLFRLGWGIAGNKHARFAAFVRPWGEVRRYAAKFMLLSPPPFIGHNPLGGWMVVALLATLAAVVGTGLFSYVGVGGAGPLAGLLPRAVAKAMTEIHSGATSLLMLLVVGHIIGVLAHWVLRRENLTRAMWTGRKTLPADEDGGDAGRGRLWVAVVMAAGALAVVWAVVA